MKIIKSLVNSTGLMLMIATWTFSGQCHAEQATNDLEALQGTWKTVSFEMRGRKMPADYILQIKGDQWTVIQPNGKSNTCPFRITSSLTPRQIDMIPVTSTNEPMSKGIYKLEGDTLTICRTEGGRARPQEFKTTSRAGILAVWQREKK